jgi:hypothetical protein
MLTWSSDVWLQALFWIIHTVLFVGLSLFFTHSISPTAAGKYCWQFHYHVPHTFFE